MTYMSKKSFREGLSLIGCAVWGSSFNSLNIHFLHPYLRENELGFLGSGLFHGWSFNKGLQREGAVTQTETQQEEGV